MSTHTSKKQSQRTKGNVRPSSSRQAAQLLSESGTTQQGFIGFGTFSGEPAYVPAADLDNLGDMSLDAELRVLLRKLSKKDSITKIKALQEFNLLIKDKEEKDVKAVLPYWPRIYSKMVLDVDYRVRETVQQSMNILAMRLHRQLAPHLKKLMAYWLLSICDPYPTVATAAQQAFNSAFSTAKQAQALSFCQESILEYTTDNLLNQRAETLSDPKLTSSEDMINKYNRILSSSLLALCKLLHALSSKPQSVCEEKIIMLLESSKLWNLCKSPVSSIRSSSFLFLAAVCQVIPEIANNYLKKLSPCILLSVDDSDVIACGSIWEAVLSLVNMSEECWKHVSVPKGVWPKLRTVLAEGCQGNAAVIGPSILPLLSKFPKEFIGQPQQFYEQFFSNMKTGIGKETVQLSPSECSAMVTALMECIHFMIKVHPDTLHLTDTHLIFMDQLVPIVQASLIEEKATLSRSPLYSKLGSFLQVLAESAPPLHPDTSDSPSLAHQCWKQVTDVTHDCLNAITSDTQSELVIKTSHKTVSTRLINLVQSLIYPTKFQPRQEKTVSVNFSDVVSHQWKAQSTTSPKRDHTALNTFQKEFASEFILKSYGLISKELDITHVHLFVNFMKLYPTEEMVGRLLLITAEPQLQLRHETATETFISSVLLKWLKQMQLESSQSHLEKCGADLVSLLFVLLSSLDDNQIFNFMDDICQEFTKSCLFKILLNEILVSQRKIPALQEWLSRPTLGKKLLSLTSNVCSQALMSYSATEITEAEDNWTILTLALSSSSQSEPLLKTEYVKDILHRIHQTLRELGDSKDCDKVDHSVLFVARVMSSFFQGLQDCSWLSSAEDLLLIMFLFSLDNDLNISELTRSEVRSAWVTGLETLLKQRSLQLIESIFFTRIFQEIMNVVVNKVNSMQQLNRVCEEVKRFLQTACRQTDNDLIISHMSTCLTKIDIFADHLMPPRQFQEYLMLTGQLTAVFWDLEGQPNGSGCRFPGSLLYTSLFLAYMLEILQGWSSDKESDCKSLNWIQKDPQILELFYGLICSTAICQHWLDTDQQVVKNTCIQKEISELNRIITKQIEYLDKEQAEKLLDLFIQKSVDASHWRALGLNLLLSHCSTNELSESRIKCYFEEESTESQMQTFRVILKHCPDTVCWEMTKMLVNQLLPITKEQLLQTNRALRLLPLINMALDEYEFHKDSQKQATFLELLNSISVWRDAENVFLFNCNIMSSPAHLVLLNSEAMHYLQLMWSLQTDLNENQRDFIMCSVASWIQSVYDSKDGISTSTAVQVFTVNISKLLFQVAQSYETNADLPGEAITEWNEFFSQTIYNLLLHIYVQLAGSLMSVDITKSEEHLLAWLGEAVTCCPKDQLMSLQLEPTGAESNPTCLLETILSHFCPMLLSKVYCIQVTAYHILNKIVNDLHSLESSTVSLTEDSCLMKLQNLNTVDKEKNPAAEETPAKYHFEDDDEDGRQPNKILMETLMKSWKGIETHLDPNESIDKQFTPCHCTLGYLLTWKLQLHFLRTASSELRAHYLRYLDTLNLITVLLDDLFSLIPETLVTAYQCRKDELSTVNIAFKKKLSCTSAPSADKLLQNVACLMFEEALETIPAVVRQWWRKQDRAFASFIDNFTKLFISPILCSKEIQNILNLDMNLENIVIRARSTSREIVAVYTMDDISIEMIIALPDNYPLGSINVRSEQRKGISSSISKKWLLQLNLFLQHQNGSIMDGLRLWKRNIDKKFEGVEECTICYCVVHGTNFQLPKIQCKICRKKFHSICLYKWFNESQNSSCPLCRNLF